MQEVFSKKISLSNKCRSIYERLKHLDDLNNLSKSKEQQNILPISYNKLALEFGCGTQQIRRYFVELERSGLIKRLLIPSNSAISTNIQILKEDTMKATNKKGAAL